MLQKADKSAPGIEQKLTPESEGLLGFPSGLNAGRIGFDLRPAASPAEDRRPLYRSIDAFRHAMETPCWEGGEERRRGVGCARAGWGGVRAVLTRSSESSMLW